MQDSPPPWQSDRNGSEISAHYCLLHIISSFLPRQMKRYVLLLFMKLHWVTEKSKAATVPRCTDSRTTPSNMEQDLEPLCMFLFLSLINHAIMSSHSFVWYSIFQKYQSIARFSYHAPRAPLTTAPSRVISILHHLTVNSEKRRNWFWISLEVDLSPCHQNITKNDWDTGQLLREGLFFLLIMARPRNVSGINLRSLVFLIAA